MNDGTEQVRASAASTVARGDQHSAEDAAQSNERGNEHGNDTVTIMVNNVAVRIHRGRQSVAQIKAAGHVALADDLEQLIDKRLTLLTDDGSITLKGDEVFVSHPKASASSHEALFATGSGRRTAAE